MSTPDPKVQIPAPNRRRVRYSDDFKRQVVAACHAPGASKAAIALANGLNANMLRRWVVQSSRGGNSELTTITKPRPLAHANPDFIPVQLTPTPSIPAADIRIELQHVRGPIQIHWPLAASSQCAQWLREVLA
jgi:transposase